MSRAERRERWEASFSPNRLALAGVALSLVLLLQPSLTGRVLILLFAASVAIASGRRLSPIMTLIIMVGIITANLLVPMGRKLAFPGPLVITELALLEGLRKAVTFEGLIFISKASLGPGLRFPGKLGSLFAEAFQLYDRILEQRGRVRVKTLMTDIDGILNTVYYGTEPEYTENCADAAVMKTGSSITDSGHSRPKGDRLLPLCVGLSLLTFLL